MFFFVASFRPPFFFPPHETSLRSARANRCLRPPVFAYGAQSDEWVVPVVEPFRLSPSPSRAEGHSIAHENTMNAIAALPSLTVAPRARVTRKVAAKARAVRPDRAGRGDHRTADHSRIFPEWLACVGVARGALRRAETPRLPAATARLTRHDPNPVNHETQARVTVMAQKQVRLGAAIHARPKPRAHDRDSVAVSERRFRFIYVFPVRCFCSFSKDGPSRLPLTSVCTKIINSHHDSRAKTGGARR